MSSAVVFVRRLSYKLRQYSAKWKITAVHPEGAWELYDIGADRTEMHNLADAHPEIVKRMAAQWERWAKDNYAVPWIWNPAHGKASTE